MIYEGRAWYEYDHGFGAEHNGELYWTNVDALTSDVLFGRLGSHRITMGLTDYSAVRDLDGGLLPQFQSYTSIGSSAYFDDTGSRSLTGVGGTNGDYILGLAGNDVLFGRSGNDLLSGGRGIDRLEGRGGRDILAGGSGADHLIGGAQADVFLMTGDDFPLLIGPVPQDRITDYNRGTGTYLATEGDLIDLSGIAFAGGAGSASNVRLRSVAASGDLPAGAVLEVLTGDVAAGNWQAIARLDGVASGEAVRIALTAAESAARTGTIFEVDAVGNGTTFSISPPTQSVTEGDVTITFTITRSGTQLGAQTVYASTFQPPGSYNDGDYDGRLNVPVFFAANDTTETFTVRIRPDAVPEGDETFGVIVQLDDSDPVSVFRASAQFTIQDGAPPVVSGRTYTGDAQDNVWSGGSGRDMAFGLGGNDRLSGAGGSDILVGGDGDDSLFGGAGNDLLMTGDGYWHYADAGSGNDVIDARQADYAQGSIDGGVGDDRFFLGSGNNGSDVVLNVSGGAGIDTAIVEARDSASTSNPGNSRGLINHFFDNSVQLTANSSFSDIEAGIASGGTHHISTGVFYWNRGYYSWLSTTGIEQFEYRGYDDSDLFLSWNNNMRVALGGAGTDALYADWSTTTAAIVWNVTVNNDVQRTLGNGVVVQSIERLMLKTGSGNDNLIMGDQDDHVETGAGNDSIVTGAGTNYVDAGSGNDMIDARQENYAQDTILAGIGDDTIFAGSANQGGSHSLMTVDGGSGTDLLIVEARNSDAGQWWDRYEALISHRFGAGARLFSGSSYADIEAAIASGDQHIVTSAVYGWNGALLHKWAEGQSFPFPGGTYPLASVMGVPRAVKPLSTATLTWNSAT